MSIIKEAFVEGRTTDTKWVDSEAKKNALRLDVFTHNADSFNGREFRKQIALEQIHPLTGKSIQTFGSRLEAAKWVVKNVLKVDNDPGNKRAVSITGNMHMCMLSGFKAYGFYWRHIEAKKHEESILSKAVKSGGKMIWAMGKGVQGHQIYPSIAAASKALNIGETTINDAIRKPMYSRAKGVLVREYNPTQQTLEFKNISEACKFFNIKNNVMYNIYDAGRTINNYTLSVKNREEVKMVKVYRVIGPRGKIIEEFSSKIKIARKYNIANRTLDNAMADKVPFSGMLRCVEALIPHKKVKD